MRTKLIVIGCLIASGMHAQSMDVGGIQITLGTQSDSARRSLENKFMVRTDSGCVGCDAGTYRLFIIPRGAGTTLGSVAIRAYRVYSITKLYQDTVYAHDFRAAYTTALKELHDLGGVSCTTRFPLVDSLATTVSDYNLQTGIRTTVAGNLVASIEVDCGKFRLVLQLPHGASTDPGLTLQLVSDSPEQT